MSENFGPNNNMKPEALSPETKRRIAWKHYCETLEDLLHYDFLPVECIQEMAAMLLAGPPSMSGLVRISAATYNCVADCDVRTRIVDGAASVQDYVKYAVAQAIMTDFNTATHTLWARITYWEHAKRSIAELKCKQETNET